MERGETTTQELISGSAKWKGESLLNLQRERPPLLIYASFTSDKPACDGALVH